MPGSARMVGATGAGARLSASPATPGPEAAPSDVYVWRWTVDTILDAQKEPSPPDAPPPPVNDCGEHSWSSIGRPISVAVPFRGHVVFLTAQRGPRATTASTCPPPSTRFRRRRALSDECAVFYHTADCLAVDGGYSVF
jgi:hypothetical protein